MGVATGVVDVYVLSVGKRCPGPYLSNEPSHDVVGQSLKNAIFRFMGVATDVVNAKDF